MFQIGFIEGFHSFDGEFVGGDIDADILARLEPEADKSTAETKVLFIGETVR